MVASQQLVWMSVIPFFAAFYLCKASLLAIYLQLFPTHLKMQRVALWITIGYCTLAFTASMSTHLFLCLPIEGNWYVQSKTGVYLREELYQG